MAVGGSAPVLSDAVKTNATHDGEDVITGLVEKAAGAVLNTILSKKVDYFASAESQREIASATS